MLNQRRLDILSKKDALALFTAMYQREGHPLTSLFHASAPRIVAAVGYHTYAVRLISAYAADTRPDLDQLALELEHDPTLALGIRNIDASEFLGAVFARSLDALPAEAHALILALGLVPATVLGRLATLALGAGIGLSTEDADNAVTLLARRAIITITAEGGQGGGDSVRVQLHPLMHAYAHQCAETQWTTEQQQASLDTLEAFFVEYTTTTTDAALASDEALIHAVIERAQDLEHREHLVALCIEMCIYWRDRSRIQAVLRYLPWGIAAAQTQATTDDERAKRRLASLQVALGDIYAATGRLTDAEHAYEANLAERRAVSDRQGQGAALNRLGQVAQKRGRLDEAADYFQQALLVVREVQDRQGEGDVLGYLGQVALLRGRLDEATDYFQQSLLIHREVQDRRSEGVDLSSLGQVAQGRRQLDRAADYFQQSLLIRREVQDRRGEGVVLSDLGKVAQNRRQLDRATNYFQQSLLIRREVQDRQGEGVVLNNLAFIAQNRGQLGKATAYFQQALVITREVQDRRMEGTILNNLGGVAQSRRQLDEAADYYQQSLLIRREVQDRRGEGVVLYRIAQLSEEMGVLAQAEEAHRESLAIAIELGLLPDIAPSQEGLAAFLMRHVPEQSRREACQLFAQAKANYQELGQSADAERMAERIRELGCETL